ncbi:unnamed protein product [Amoebophrya sp. A25]|nr:unnamed protein product [Amoebophrya sp. A25]|eukprot:GSA25T00025065001.1
MIPPLFRFASTRKTSVSSKLMQLNSSTTNVLTLYPRRKDTPRVVLNRPTRTLASLARCRKGQAQVAHFSSSCTSSSSFYTDTTKMEEMETTSLARPQHPLIECLRRVFVTPTTMSNLRKISDELQAILRDSVHPRDMLEPPTQGSAVDEPPAQEGQDQVEAQPASFPLWNSIIRHCLDSVMSSEVAPNEPTGEADGVEDDQHGQHAGLTAIVGTVWEAPKGMASASLWTLMPRQTIPMHSHPAYVVGKLLSGKLECVVEVDKKQAEELDKEPTRTSTSSSAGVGGSGEIPTDGGSSLAPTSTRIARPETVSPGEIFSVTPERNLHQLHNPSDSELAVFFEITFPTYAEEQEEAAVCDHGDAQAAEAEGDVRIIPGAADTVAIEDQDNHDVAKGTSCVYYGQIENPTNNDAHPSSDKEVSYWKPLSEPPPFRIAGGGPYIGRINFSSLL